MDRHTPASPTPVKPEPAFPSGFNELLQHNATTPYAHDVLSPDPMHAHSQPVSRYGTPGPQAHQLQGIDSSIAYPQLSGVGDMMYHPPVGAYPPNDCAYGPIPEPYGTPATSPPTPSRGPKTVTSRAAARADLSARVLGPRSTRVEKSVPKRKKERAKPPKNMPVLDKPMSELTKASSIPVADIETYVHRSADARRQEIETGKTPGRVKRPMNAFMLYRKAYQQRAKEWASQHNHQIVSRVCGLSWPLEPEHIRQQFKTWADIERDNHQKAHPNYKFTPAKPQKAAPRFEGSFDDRSEGSDLDDYDWAGRGASQGRSATRTPGADSDYIPSRAVQAAIAHNQLAGLNMMGMGHPTRSSTMHDFGQGKPMPAGYPHHDVHGHYPDLHMGNPQQRHMEALMHRSPSPSLAFQHSNFGLHAHSPYDFSQYHQVMEQPSVQMLAQQHVQSQQHAAQQFEQRIDPSLMPQDDVLFNPSDFNGLSGILDGGIDGELDGALDGAAQEAWSGTQLPAGTEPESQFSNAILGLDDPPLSAEQQAQYFGGNWQVEQIPENAHFDINWVEPKAE
ncbi:uncharacterized protein C8A04DRAFT_11254 [Dichotomopilus funicola]|uniref:HMG box domain-containing protein n=1 Tax=Dichotomopilus funicola TaxID=1934379 RepID=A0AAN6V5Y3_9PEZI|nr:hypothetical protein C8A04DRAFT_11254 [Dichotomopilus funicola]